MKRCTNCGIRVGGKYTIMNHEIGEEETKVRMEQELHDFHGRQVCGWCLSLISQRGWIRRDSGDRATIQFADGSRFVHPLGVFQSLDKNIDWGELRDKVAARQL